MQRRNELSQIFLSGPVIYPCLFVAGSAPRSCRSKKPRQKTHHYFVCCSITSSKINGGISQICNAISICFPKYNLLQSFLSKNLNMTDEIVDITALLDKKSCFKQYFSCILNIELQGVSRILIEYIKWAQNWDTQKCIILFLDPDWFLFPLQILFPYLIFILLPELPWVKRGEYAFK